MRCCFLEVGCFESHFGNLLYFFRIVQCLFRELCPDIVAVILAVTKWKKYYFILGQFFLFWTHFGCLFMSWVSQYFLMIFCTERFCVFIRILNKILCWVFLYLGHFGVFWIHFGVWSSKNRENHPIYMNFHMLPLFSEKFSKSSCCNWSWPRCDEYFTILICNLIFIYIFSKLWKCPLLDLCN